MQTFRRGLRWISLGLVMGPALWACAQEPPARRARPPKWDTLPPGVFFDDAFAEGLRGERPSSLSSQPLPPASRPATATPSAPSDEAANSLGWSRLVSAATLENELKTIKRHMDQALQNEGYFKGQGYRELRPHLGTAAVLFAIIDQFDGPVRWQPDAALARDRFARVAQNAKAGSSQVFKEAALRQQDLDDLIRGARLTGAGSDAPLEWPDVADRQLIMQRLEGGVQQTISTAVASAGEFRRQRDTLLHEGELAAALAQVLVQTDMPDAGDREYNSFCAQLQRAAEELRQSVQQDNPEAARRAHGEMKNSCVACHELYRT